VLDQNAYLIDLSANEGGPQAFTETHGKLGGKSIAICNAWHIGQRDARKRVVMYIPDV
jgi:hypothetical protein